MNNNFFIIGKSLVNFCELDLNIFGIGEIYNVASSFIIVFFGLYGLYNINFNFNFNTNMNANTNTNMNANINTNIYMINLIKTRSNILYLLETLIGFGSVYFHYELSPFAHWVDIIFISITLVYAQYILSSYYNPNDLINKYKYKYKYEYKYKYIGIMLIHLITSIYIPQIHIFILFALGFNIKSLIEYKIINNIKKNNNNNNNNNNNEIMRKYWWIKKYFIFGLGFWIIDFFGCDFIAPFHTHWIFHIFIGLMTYKIIDLMKYL